MRFTYISTEFPNPETPTRATFQFDLLASLAQHHTVDVVAPVPWLELLRAKLRPGSDICRWRQQSGMRIHHPPFVYPPGLMRNRLHQFLWRSLREYREATFAQSPDCVVSYWAHPDGAAAVRFAKMVGVPSIVMIGGSDVLLMTKNASRRRQICKVLIEADAVVPVSSSLKQRIEQLGVPPEKIHVIRRGIDQSAFYPGDQRASRRRLGFALKDPLILWVGRMVAVKDVATLIRAFHHVVTSAPNTKLVLIGGGPQKATLKSLVEKLGLRGSVVFRGAVPHDALGDYYRAANVFALSSRSEGIPNVLLESIACGTPFVSTDVGGVAELDAHGLGRLVPTAAPAEFAAAILQSLETSRTNRIRDVKKPRTLADSAIELAELAESISNPTQVATTLPVGSLAGQAV